MDARKALTVAQDGLAWLDGLAPGTVRAGLSIGPGVTVTDPDLYLARLRSDLAGEAGPALQQIAVGHLAALYEALTSPTP